MNWVLADSQIDYIILYSSFEWIRVESLLFISNSNITEYVNIRILSNYPYLIPIYYSLKRLSLVYYYVQFDKNSILNKILIISIFDTLLIYNTYIYLFIN